MVSLCRGGFYPGLEEKSREESVEDNKRAIEDAAALGAPLVVLVCGAVPGQSLVESRKQITDGIASTLPLAESLGVKLAIEPLHPMYADDRSAINTLGTANEICDELNHPLVGIAFGRLSPLVGSGFGRTDPTSRRCQPSFRLPCLRLDDPHLGLAQ